MAHIHNTLIRKRLVDEATKDESTRYRKLVEKAQADGFSDCQIVAELEAEADRIRKDIRIGDSLFLKGVANAQEACLRSIATLISELKGQSTQGQQAEGE